jgi:hypothetical protein
MMALTEEQKIGIVRALKLFLRQPVAPVFADGGHPG